MYFTLSIFYQRNFFNLFRNLLKITNNNIGMVTIQFDRKYFHEHDIISKLQQNFFKM